MFLLFFSSSLFPHLYFHSHFQMNLLALFVLLILQSCLKSARRPKRCTHSLTFLTAKIYTHTHFMVCFISRLLRIQHYKVSVGCSVFPFNCATLFPHIYTPSKWKSSCIWLATIGLKVCSISGCKRLFVQLLLCRLLLTPSRVINLCATGACLKFVSQ